MVETRHARVDGDDALTSVGTRMVNMRNGTIGGVRDRRLEMLARVGHVTSVVVCHFAEIERRDSE